MQQVYVVQEMLDVGSQVDSIWGESAPATAQCEKLNENSFLRYKENPFFVEVYELK